MVTLDPAARANVTLIDHPLVQHKLTLMRKKEASTSSFRRLLNELAGLMIYEVCRDMPLQDLEIETPLEKTTGKVNTHEAQRSSRSISAVKSPGCAT